MPYAIVEVTASKSPKPVVLAIAHKLDFFKLWMLYKEGCLTNSYDVFLYYRPARGLKALFKDILPCIEYSVFMKGDITNEEWIELGIKRVLLLYGQEREMDGFL